MDAVTDRAGVAALMAETIIAMRDCEPAAVALAVLAQQEAAGLRVVPVEATDAQHDAARDWSYDKYGRPIGTDASRGCWDAMLAASPFAPPQQGDGT